MTGGSGRKALILVVDDDAAVRQSLRALLTSAGYDVLEASDGIEAVRQLGASSVDVMILDLIMPERDGLETIRIVRKDHPGIKIIAVSEQIPYLLRTAELMGAFASLSKPLAAKPLLNLLKGALDT